MIVEQLTPEETASKLVDDWLVQNHVSLRPLAYSRLVAAIIPAFRSVAQAQRERDALYLEGRAAEIEDGHDAASIPAWLARILRDEAQRIREG